jgi:hypothetical protein
MNGHVGIEKNNSWQPQLAKHDKHKKSTISFIIFSFTSFQYVWILTIP